MAKSLTAKMKHESRYNTMTFYLLPYYLFTESHTTIGLRGSRFMFSEVTTTLLPYYP